MRKIVQVRRSERIPAAEAARLGTLRATVAEKIDELRARARQLLMEARAVRSVCATLKCVREQQGLSLGDIERLTGIDRSALSKLERGERTNITFETLGKYAAALGKRLVIDVTDADR